jgi:uncharacterized damage-inducible protein DinB
MERRPIWLNVHPDLGVGRRPVMMVQTYSRLIAIKCWADRGLYDVVGRNIERLTSEEVSIMLRIFDHMHVVDRIFQQHLRGLPHEFRAPRSERMPEFQELASSAREVDDWYEQYVAGLAESDLEHSVDLVFTSGKSARMRRCEIIQHVCLHGTYHRGNAGAVLQLKGITPSRDSVTDFLEDAARMPPGNGLPGASVSGDGVRSHI